ncbi:hypothetical protein [Xanthomonas phage RTH11]|nr:hypothetical protein [Xanthomonas phage RTH11]
MKLDDVFQTAGDHQLSGFAWGASAVVLYNTLVAPPHAIDVSHTGTQARDKLRALPTSTLLAVLSRRVLLEGDAVEFIGTAREQADGVPPTVPTNTRRVNPMAMVLMAFLLMICGVLTFGAYQGKTDPETLKVIITALVDLSKDAYKDPNQPAAPKPAEETVTP